MEKRNAFPGVLVYVDRGRIGPHPSPSPARVLGNGEWPPAKPRPTRRILAGFRHSAILREGVAKCSPSATCSRGRLNAGCRSELDAWVSTKRPPPRRWHMPVKRNRTIHDDGFLASLSPGEFHCLCALKAGAGHLASPHRPVEALRTSA
ncbi:unnamed protein product [Ectocarpus sp. 4 AP-2014]